VKNRKVRPCRRVHFFFQEEGTAAAICPESVFRPWCDRAAQPLDGTSANRSPRPATPAGRRMLNVLIEQENPAQWRVRTPRPLRSRGGWGSAGQVAKGRPLASPGAWCPAAASPPRPTTTLKRCWLGKAKPCGPSQGTALRDWILLAMSGPRLGDDLPDRPGAGPGTAGWGSDQP